MTYVSQLDPVEDLHFPMPLQACSKNWNALVLEQHPLQFLWPTGIKQLEEPKLGKPQHLVLDFFQCHLSFLHSFTECAKLLELQSCLWLSNLRNSSTEGKRGRSPHAEVTTKYTVYPVYQYLQ